MADRGAAERMRTEILAALDSVIDPCSEAAGCPAGLAEMGLVSRIDLEQRDDGYRAIIEVSVTDPGCMMGAVFLTRARQALAGIDGLEATLRLSDTIDWGPEKLSGAYAKRLAAHRLSRQPRSR